jgi:cell division protein ZapA
MACDDGEEEHLEHLARDFDARIDGLRTSFGEIGDQRIIVMAALSVADELADTRRQIAELTIRLADTDRESRSRGIEEASRQDHLALTLGEAAQRIERMAHKMRDNSRA